MINPLLPAGDPSLSMGSPLQSARLHARSSRPFHPPRYRRKIFVRVFPPRQIDTGQVKGRATCASGAFPRIVKRTHARNNARRRRGARKGAPETA